MKLNKAQISRNAIQRLYISMRHLFFRGYYKPLGMSGAAMINAMLDLTPEIYGSMGDPSMVEIDGLLYVYQRLPQGIEECRYVNLTSREGYEQSNFKPLIPAKRRRNCYRIDSEQMNIEMTRGRSDIYDVLTHLTFLYIEAEKIKNNALDPKGRKKREWIILEEIHEKLKAKKKVDEQVGLSYVSRLIGRTYEETSEAYQKFAKASKVNNFFSIVYHMGRRSIDEHVEKKDREISFSSILRQELGNHYFGEQWANKIKSYIFSNAWEKRPIHIISSNLHSVMNSLYAKEALEAGLKKKHIQSIATELSKSTKKHLREKVRKLALKQGMHEIYDDSGTNITVQVFDLKKLSKQSLSKCFGLKSKEVDNESILIVMDYAFGEQAYECMDELLKPYDGRDKKEMMNVASISIMGKAGILEGGKGDVMIPNAHVFEGTADNYPVKNKFDDSVFEGSGLGVYKGPMITVMGTSLQNKDILRYFHLSSWKAVGLEMEGAHYQKAIQSASQIRNSVKQSVVLRYAYYASDNPLHTGSTLASGGLGTDGVKPTYLITESILKSIFSKK